jgi:hypothetical protein
MTLRSQHVSPGRSPKAGKLENRSCRWVATAGAGNGTGGATAPQLIQPFLSRSISSMACARS